MSTDATTDATTDASTVSAPETSHAHSHAHDAGSSHSHSHSHAHSHGPANYNSAFAIGIALNLGFVLLEVVYGLRSGSLALVADAGHNFGDVLGLALAWVAALLALRLPTRRHTYGMRRSSILAALANAIFLLITVGAIAWEAILRFQHPEVIDSRTVVWVAALGIAINLGTALLFVRGRKGDLNIRGAFLHMAADAAVSLGVVAAGIVIGITGWLWVDPVVSLLVVAVITIGTWSLLTESLHLALDAVPESINIVEVENYLRSIPDVTAVHDLHVWGMSTTDVALTAHLVKPVTGDDDGMLIGTCQELQRRFGIGHATLQIERGHGPQECRQAPAEVV
ncbi:MAG: cation diffusion facilitator family transporter [Gemmatimonadaceae bacterium]